jgi:hypothetical protein
VHKNKAEAFNFAFCISLALKVFDKNQAVDKPWQGVQRTNQLDLQSRSRLKYTQRRPVIVEIQIQDVFCAITGSADTSVSAQAILHLPTTRKEIFYVAREIKKTLQKASRM